MKKIAISGLIMMITSGCSMATDALRQEQNQAFQVRSEDKVENCSVRFMQNQISKNIEYCIYLCKSIHQPERVANVSVEKIFRE